MSASAALITGGTSGIGKATAELLHSRGYRVMVTGVGNVANAGLPEDVTVVRADARSLPDLDHAMDRARRRFGSLDLLFLNAGISRPGPLESTDEDAFDALFDINVKGAFFTLQKALPLLNEGASVVFTVGAGEGIGAAMTAAKGALLPLMRALALELAPRRIRVNAVSPGMIDTPAYGKLGVSREMLDSWARDVPLGRVGAPADIAEAVAFLASDAAGYITGDNLTVSGGIGVHTRP
ncbi:SDR family oxidoreductase [Streptomyces rapamycinicus]|uniref:Oxidoreductase n=2 Tax=Streptomyces rapamycinicus TaxID=1226757 RepID=A0A0A0NNY2_STRRN|nr:SDR family oxidoreductase [Streptomyces rapamycinicus]AGP56065.1 oxidoreductase [Streptomyces rapamycinicus NRRL 5491]MBB4783667.1 NAD(P)-dependent dehydrogenase (short-subunit alcohol dehydrogenase family) [Streptomyces rapamycinicus]RLV80861.1 oxidoreductase [Streptomyces rapamycinicus NRRL 5491]UTO64038.1 SDR family oxidoreductase [Streptomyces rapamycinicus]UTP31991.1 SDR family oxidoreductase [Streptomyces rapamycinicus NRRL 5491]